VEAARREFWGDEWIKNDGYHYYMQARAAGVAWYPSPIWSA
jgi:hypothetical protein